MSLLTNCPLNKMYRDSLITYLPLSCIDSKTGYLDLLTIFAYPDWKVLAIPGFVVNPIRLYFNIAGFVFIKSSTLKNLY